MQAVEAVLEADALDAAVAGGLDDGADDGVEAGGVAAAGEDADALDAMTLRPTIANGRRARCGGAKRRVTLGVRFSSLKWAASSVGRAPRSQRGGREFEPPAVHQILQQFSEFLTPLRTPPKRRFSFPP